MHSNHQNPNTNPNRNTTVVLVHGLAANRVMMWPLARRLRRQGFTVINYGYWSSRQRIEQHAEKLTPVLQQLQDDPAVERIHLVTHSMGCIIGRWILSRQRFEKIDRWVMLAPPNRGSHAADSIGRFFQWLLIPIDQLSESPDSFVNRIPDFRKTNAVNFSIVEASKDLVIRSASLPLEGMSDYAVIPCHHGPMPFNRQVGQYVERFLTAD